MLPPFSGFCEMNWGVSDIYIKSKDDFDELFASESDVENYLAECSTIVQGLYGSSINCTNFTTYMNLTLNGDTTEVLAAISDITINGLCINTIFDFCLCNIVFLVFRKKFYFCCNFLFWDTFGTCKFLF